MIDFKALERISRTVAYKTIYYDLTDSHTAALLLSQLCYWYSNDKNGKQRLRVKKEGHYWVAKTYEEWFDECRLTRTQLTGAIKILVKLGIVIKKVFRFNGLATTHLRLNEEKLNTLISEYLEKVKEDIKEEKAAETQENSRNAENLQTGNAENLQTEKQKTCKPLTDTTTKITTDIKDIYSQIQNLYNELCPSLPKAQTLTDKRKKLIKARWKQCNDLDTYRELFIKAEDSDFLSGRDGTWTACNFDWLLNENNMTKVLEGTYRNGQAQKSNPKNRFHNFEQSALNMSKEELKAALHKNDEPFDISQLPADSMARKLALREEVRANKHKWLANNPTYEIDYEAASKSKYGW